MTVTLPLRCATTTHRCTLQNALHPRAMQASTAMSTWATTRTVKINTACRRSTRRQTPATISTRACHRSTWAHRRRANNTLRRRSHRRVPIKPTPKWISRRLTAATHRLAATQRRVQSTINIACCRSLPTLASEPTSAVCNCPCRHPTINTPAWHCQVEWICKKIMDFIKILHFQQHQFKIDKI